MSNLTDNLTELDEVNMLLQFIEQDIMALGFPTSEQLKEHSELSKRTVDIASRIPDIIGNK